MNQGRRRLDPISQSEVIRAIEKAKQAVTRDLEEIGIDTSILNFHCQIKPVSEEDLEARQTQDNSDIDSDFEESYDVTAAEDFFHDKQASEQDENDEECEELQEDINFLLGSLLLL